MCPGGRDTEGNEIAALWTAVYRDICASTVLAARCASTRASSCRDFCCCINTAEKQPRHGCRTRFHERVCRHLAVLHACTRARAPVRSTGPRYLISVTEKSRDYLETFELPRLENRWNSGRVLYIHAGRCNLRDFAVAIFFSPFDVRIRVLQFFFPIFLLFSFFLSVLR